MVYGISNQLITAVLFAGLFGAGVTALYYRRVTLRVEEEVRDLEAEAVDELNEDSTGYGVELPPPDVGRSVLDIFKVWLHVRKQARLAKRGYIKWYRVGSRLHKPKWIKPEHKGAGEYEYTSRKDDQTYVFPEEALVTDGVTSAFVAIHKIGEAEPIDLRDPGWATLDADRLQTVIDLEIAREPPGSLSSLPLSSQQLKWVGFGLLFVVVYFGLNYTGMIGGG
jgi:hypothetical protein